MSLPPDCVPPGLNWVDRATILQHRITSWTPIVEAVVLMIIGESEINVPLLPKIRAEQPEQARLEERKK